MNKKSLFLITLVAILILIILSTYTEKSYEGKIKKIESSETRTTITLENKNETFVLFDSLSLKQDCKEIIIYGKEDYYRNKKQIIVDKIKCLK